VSSLPTIVAVCDVGGGSAEAVVGTADGGPAWSRSLDIGAVRLSERFLSNDPPGRRALIEARDEVERHLEGFTPPLPQAALATGGTARALRKLVGWELEAEEFDVALRILGNRPSAKVAKTFGLHAHRARTLAAGIVILSCLQGRLGVPLEVSRAGLREGAALALLDELAASAA
jgi:exopolyphosphatase/guanosine-5'-triphosphate,3'-diphosphate pyrophosphatase